VRVWANGGNASEAGRREGPGEGRDGYFVRTMGAILRGC
jgi:hypothetical protein